MIPKKDYDKIAGQLQEHLAAAFPDVTVRIGDEIHYRGTNVVITSEIFRGLLPEQRFHHVVRAIPQPFYDKYFKGGVVWFELAPGESGKALMKMPRSEDGVADAPAIAAMLKKKDFAGRLRALADKKPEKLSAVGFDASREVLKKAKVVAADLQKSELFFILNGGYCDVQVLADVLPKLEGDA